MSAPLPPPGWHPDPTGRHEMRYWDGARWSEHVSDRGQVSADDLATPPPVEEPVVEEPVVEEPAALGAPPPSVPAGGTGIVDPTAAPPGRVAAPGAPPQMMRGIGGLAAALTVLLWITVAVAAFGVFAFANRVSVASDILDFDFEDGGFGELVQLQQRADDADNLVGMATAFTFLCSIAIAVLLIIWMWRVAKNAQLSGRVQPRFGPGWTIGGWFIPFANLVIPVLVMQDLWRASDPRVTRGDPEWRRAAGSGLVGWWWALHIVAAMRFIGGGDADSRAELESLRTRDALSAGGSLVAIAAAVLLILVVRGITRRQEALFAGVTPPPV